MSIFGKIRTAFLGSVNDLLDRVIDLNSPSAVRQHIRDLEHAMDQMTDAVAQQRAVVVGFSQEMLALNTKKNTLNRAIDAILGDDVQANDYKSEVYMAQVVDIEGALKTKEEGKSAADQAAGGLNQALGSLKKKHGEMITSLKNLEAQDQATKAKENATNALKLGSQVVAGMSGVVSVDNLQKRSQDRANLADARFQQALQGVQQAKDDDSPEATLQSIEIKRRLAERAAQLAGNKVGTTQPLS